MTETLSFPGLGLEFEIGRVAFHLGPLPIYWYGILIAAAFLAGAAYMLRRAKTFGLDGDRLMDVILGSVLLGIVGARLYYVLFSWSTYQDDPMRIFSIREGGLAIYGGIIGAFVGAYFLCKWRKVKFLPTLDLAVGGLLIGQAIGRWGNFVNIEAFGSNTTAPWGMTSRSIASYLSFHRQDLAAIGVAVDPAVPVHPTFFYESAWCLLGFFFLYWFSKRRRFDGQMTLLYFIWYGAGRFFIEGLRTDSLLLGTMRVSQVLALLCVLAAGIAMVTVLSRIRRENDPEYLKLYVETEEGQQVVAGEFYKQFAKKKDSESAEEATASDTDDCAEKTEQEDSSENSDEAPSDAEAGESSTEDAEKDASNSETETELEKPIETESTEDKDNEETVTEGEESEDGKAN